MASELALSELQSVPAGGIVLDPMAGSGTVIRHASDLGYRAFGFDMDPLAVLMSRVWTTPADDTAIQKLASRVLREARSLSDDEVRLPNIDDDAETKAFVEFWFAPQQRSDLRRLAYVLAGLSRRGVPTRNRIAADVLRLAMTRLIVTKDRGASLARDVSHSRPHKVAETTSFDVMSEFDRSVAQLRKILQAYPPRGNVEVKLGDARSLRNVSNGSIDLVLTSPPYLNAIDYMRGHRLALVWLGYRFSELRQIRSTSIGAERAPDIKGTKDLFMEICDSMTTMSTLSSRHANMVHRYAEDTYRLMSEVARVLKQDGRAVFVVGNSCLKGTFIRNSDGVKKAALMVGLRVNDEFERELPAQHRYLPMPANKENPLGNRMRTETILTFSRH